MDPVVALILIVIATMVIVILVRLGKRDRPRQG
jgi:hypothetical protein